MLDLALAAAFWASRRRFIRHGAPSYSFAFQLPLRGKAGVVFPSYRQLAQRFRARHSVIADYAKKANCLRRREQATMRVQAKTEEKLIELRATTFAMSKDDTLRIKR